jgi:hypothetical protein
MPLGSAIDALPQFLANLEKRQFLALYLDKIAGLGVPAFIAIVRSHPEAANHGLVWI